MINLRCLFDIQVEVSNSWIYDWHSGKSLSWRYTFGSHQHMDVFKAMKLHEKTKKVQRKIERGR